MIRTLVVLRPGQTRDGIPVLKGELSRDVVTTDATGRTRTYPRGTEVLLRRRGDSYSLLAIVADELPKPLNATAIAAANEHDRQAMGEGFVPY
jgi:hypothetical protein